MREFKEEVASAVDRGISNIRDRYNFFTSLQQFQYLKEVAALGAEKARLKATGTMTQVRELIGFD